MQEFSTASGSASDPAALAVTLTEKSAAGWNVVGIVSTPTVVTAFLSREAGAADSAAAASPSLPASSSSSVTAALSSLASASAAGLPASAATAEPAGWAIAPESADSSQSSPSLASTTSMAPISTPSAEPAASSTPATPAGWYADPAGRFDLRYWDGTAWTEHVSRAGQQYTDAPVA